MNLLTNQSRLATTHTFRGRPSRTCLPPRAPRRKRSPWSTALSRSAREQHITLSLRDGQTGCTSRLGIPTIQKQWHCEDRCGHEKHLNFLIQTHCGTVSVRVDNFPNSKKCHEFWQEMNQIGFSSNICVIHLTRYSVCESTMDNIKHKIRF